MAYPAITDQDVAAFWRDGFVFKRAFYDAEEVALLRRAIDLDEGIRSHIVAIDDSQGGSTQLALWNHPGDDLFGAVARGERLVAGAERILGGEVYHYHSKLTMKRPHTGGAWDWHQDYGYWYHNGCLFPDLLSVAIAVDPATRENGCLEVLKGSHRMGRIDHGRVGGQTGADMERVRQAMTVLEHVWCEMAPGDALFFHCNLVHASAPNRSDKPRNLLLCCYNKASNEPYKEHHHPRYTPLERVPDARIKELGLTLAGNARDFLRPHEDKTVEARPVSV
ncbi:MAG: phytanoyl-CoA dioxygenase family protein [Rhodospirillaceae bacterium]|nr:phytanoyl-CoA dioxygenase family protein [Rhodospirillaceae bacterium]